MSDSAVTEQGSAQSDWQSSCSGQLRPILAVRRSTAGTREWNRDVKDFEMRILLVEDHEESRRNLHRLIERRGHQVVSVGSAEDAKLALSEENFPFLILDWMLPGQSGIELCREIRAQQSGDERFILLVTARADTEDLEQA